ncbi:MAG: WecB/TagA/CpsF family glycosyltransferase [Pseudomonadota bacterium]
MPKSVTTDAGQTFPSHSMLGMRLDYLPVEEFLDEFILRAKSGTSTYCCVPDVYQCVVCHDNPDHKYIVNQADFVFSDSTILQKVRAWKHKVTPIETLLGSNLMRNLCERAENHSVRIALVGGRDDKTLANLEAALKRDFPDLELVYSYSPPFRELSKTEEAQMLGNLAASKAQLIFIGLGCPKQERWMANYKNELQAAMIGVGAAFDTLSGAVSESPDFVHRNGLEWLFRLIREPRRLYRRYLVQAPRFLWLIYRDNLVAKRVS